MERWRLEKKKKKKTDPNYKPASGAGDAAVTEFMDEKWRSRSLVRKPRGGRGLLVGGALASAAALTDCRRFCQD